MTFTLNQAIQATEEQRAEILYDIQRTQAKLSGLEAELRQKDADLSKLKTERERLGDGN